MKIETSIGEIIDKWTILNIKIKHVEGQEAVTNVKRELSMLNDVIVEIMNDNLKISKILIDAREQLQSINERLWDIEDEIRVLEARNEFNERFIELARSVYKTNDQRSKIKKRINQLTKSKYVEEKSYKTT